MGARHKLNRAVINGVLVVSAIVGAVCESFAVFVGCAVVLSLLALHAGDIRLDRRRR